MPKTEMFRFEGTRAQLAGIIGDLPGNGHYKLVEIVEGEEADRESHLADPQAAASIALLKSWIAEAPTDPDVIREAEEDLREFKKNMNLPRKEAGARLHFPEVE
jgi:hypothetical protein